MPKRGKRRTTKEQYIYLIIAAIAIFFIVLGWEILSVLERAPQQVPEDKTLDSGLFTLGLWGEQDIVLDVLTFNVSEDNETTSITINWSSGDDSFDAILFMFGKTSEICNYTSQNLLNKGEIKTYSINLGDTNCASDFENILVISAETGVDVVLTQTSLIENLTYYRGDILEELIDLDDYFSCIEDIEYSIFEDPSNTQISGEIDSTTNTISFYPETNWSGTQKFDLSADCNGEILNKSNSGQNMSFYVVVLNETRRTNSAPAFLSDRCGEWTIDIASVSSIEIDMEYCFEDSDNDPLTFRLDNSSMTRISAVIDAPYLTLTPSSDFVGGNQKFYLYANDGKEETKSSVIYVYIVSGGDGDVTLPVLDPDVEVSVSINRSNKSEAEEDQPRITGFEPSEPEINISKGESITFSIVPENYDKREWYLNGEVVAENTNSYEVGGLDTGIYEVGVKVKKGNQVETKTWDVNVYEKEFGKRNLLMVFIILACFFGLVILVVILLIIQGIRERYGMERDQVRLERGPMPEYPKDVPH